MSAADSRVIRFAFASLVSAVLAVGLFAQAPARSEQAQPAFKAGVNFVRVDVYPTAKGQIVPDLKADEFEVREDGAPQRIEMFERVVIRAPGPESARAEPRSVAEANAAAGDARNRLFVLFLDSYHTTRDATTSRMKAGTAVSKESNASDSRIGIALNGFLQRLIGPDDLVAITRPELPPDALAFTRRPSSFEDLLATGGQWQRRPLADDLPRTGDLDQTERRYLDCYSLPGLEDIGPAMIARRRERMVIGALRGVVRHLRELREERKAIVVVTEGWTLFTPDRSLARAIRGGAPGRPQVGIVNGKPTTGDPGGDHVTADCESDRVMLAQIDDAREFNLMLDEANRANASFYPVDPRGLPVFESAVQAWGRTAGDDYQSLRGRLESLRTLASATDGVAILDSNDFARNLQRISDDLSSYYLIGYSSTNAKPDGKFRRITVRVKRPGVTVRARRGYLAPTEADLKAAEPAAPPPPAPDTTAREAALDALDYGRPGQVIRLRGGYAWPLAAETANANVKAAARVAAPVEAVLSVVVELDATAARSPGWAEGGDLSASVLDLDGRTLATGSGKISPSERTCLIRFADMRLPPADYIASVKARWSVLTTAEKVRIKVPDPAQDGASALGQPMVFRRSPYAGPLFQPTADLRFRKPERVRLDVPLAGRVDAVAGQLLDRKGQPLPVPVTTTVREDAGSALVAAEVALAPLAPGDYVIEVSARRGEKTDKSFTGIRIVP